jgi:hypothetical protein
MSRRSRTFVVAFALFGVLVAGVGSTRAPLGPEQAWADKTCRITREREIYFPHHPYMTCAQAKRVLFRLKGRHDTVPMACHRARTVMGWRIRATTKVPRGMTSTYTRGRYSFQYSRPATPATRAHPVRATSPTRSDAIGRRSDDLNGHRFSRRVT